MRHGYLTHAADRIAELLEVLEPTSAREGLIETPMRAAKAWEHWTAGYNEDPASVLKVFEDGAERYDEMVVVRNLPFYSTCEHHMAAIFGTATIGYLPDKHIVGLSKLGRVLDIFARRLQVQERMTQQIAHALNDNLAPRGVGVVVKARHLCMESRGIATQGHETVTSCLLGVFKDGAVRSEFLSLSR